MRTFLCPCCNRPSTKVTQINEANAPFLLSLMEAHGYTAATALAERREDLDALAPGMTDWLQAHIAETAAGKSYSPPFG